MSKFKELSTEDVAQQLNQTDSVIVDIRPVAAYNGWPLQDERRGGHIPGAKSLPMQWTQYMDWVEVLDEKNITADRPVILYGYEDNKIVEMAEELRELNFTDVMLYNHFTDAWTNNSEWPLERLPRYKHLVYPEWVKQLIDGESPPHFKNDDFVICHSHYDFIEDYNKGHIPGAVPVNTNKLESPQTWNRRSPEELKEALQNLGIRHDMTVVIYGRFSAPVYDEEKFPGKSAGHLGALRAAAIMLYAGVEDIRILNGGITSWETKDYKLSIEETKPTPVGEFGIDIPRHPEYMVDTPEAKQLIKDDDSELVSIRSWDEFIGKQSGYHYIETKGRIPGAVFGNCGSDAYHMENYRNFDHTIREYDEVESTWEDAGITPDKHIAFYCGTGWRGSEAFWNAWLMGWPNISVYDGGWFEWCNDQNNPIETGIPDSNY